MTIILVAVEVLKGRSSFNKDYCHNNDNKDYNNNEK